MLDPSFYSGPTGIFVTHMYGKVNRIHGSRQDSDMQWTLIHAARAIRSLQKNSDGWTTSRTILKYSTIASTIKSTISN